MKCNVDIRPLKDLADIQTGPFGSQLHKEDYVEVGTPIVTVEHLGNRIFTEQNLPKVSDGDRKRLEKYLLSTGDIVFSRVGSVDRCSYVDEWHSGWMFSGRCLRIRPSECINPLYLYYYFCLKEVRQFVRNIAVGATMPSINTKLLGEVPVSVPSIQTQRRIAAILSALDDKIELNNKINANLEQQAQALYQEWFVNADDATRVGLLSEICAYSEDKIVISRLNPNTYFSTENMLPKKAGAVKASNLPTVAQTTACHVGDTLVSNIRPYFKKIVYCHEACGCSTDVLCFVPTNPTYSVYLYCVLYADSFFDFMVAGSKGTKMPRGDKQQIMTYPVVIPSSSKLAAFNLIVIPMLAKIKNNRSENKRLTVLRDGLLSKLMNGEILAENLSSFIP